jgi:RND family efflux transporter MFP subunit
MPGKSSNSTSYTTATVERSTMSVTVSGSGNGVVADATQVQPDITGTVKNLSVKLGDEVEKGDLLFKIENSDLDAAVERAHTSYLQSKQQLLQAKQTLADAKAALYTAQHPTAVAGVTPVVDSDAVSAAKAKVTSAQYGVTIAANNVSSAAEDLDAAEETADERTVRAPVDGVITVLNAKNGQSLTGNGSSSNSSAASAGSSSSSAVEIADLSTLQASVSINEVDLVNVKVGMPASVVFDSLPTVPASGTITAIAPTGTSSNSGVVTYDVVITLKNADERLRPGMSCTAEITVDTRQDALTVPSSAVRTDSSSGKKYVLVGNTSTGAISQVTVTTGVVVGTQTEVLTGLQEGQTVLIGGTSSSSASTSSSSSSQRGPGGMGGMGAFMGRD